MLIPALIPFAGCRVYSRNWSGLAW